MKHILAILVSLLLTSVSWGRYEGFNLTEYDGFIYDASSKQKTDAQIAVDNVKALGANHIELNIRASMNGPFSNEIIPATPLSESSAELKRIVRLMTYIHSQGMTVGLRPIFFVVGPNNEFPFVEQTKNGPVTWWHGNIQPSNPTNWFLSFQDYLTRYLIVAKAGKADTFTIGAELYSMTVGIEDQWKENPYGFPAQWLSLLRYAKSKVASVGTLVTYDINYTDAASFDVSGLLKAGGEIERWRYRLVDLREPNLILFWTELDLVGIDMYRSLADRNDPIPEKFDDLVTQLRKRSDVLAQLLDTTLLEIEVSLNIQKKVVLKEVGYRSTDLSFIEPYNYSGNGNYNEMHQAAAYKAIFESFWTSGVPWLEGIVFWDVPIDPGAHRVGDTGFSPVGKPLTEEQIIKYYGL